MKTKSFSKISTFRVHFLTLSCISVRPSLPGSPQAGTQRSTSELVQVYQRMYAHTHSNARPCLHFHKPPVQQWQVKFRIITLGCAFNFFDVMKGVPNYSASFACMYSFSVTEMAEAVRLVACTQMIILYVSCHNCTSLKVHSLTGRWQCGQAWSEGRHPVPVSGVGRKRSWTCRLSSSSPVTSYETNTCTRRHEQNMGKGVWGEGEVTLVCSAYSSNHNESPSSRVCMQGLRTKAASQFIPGRPDLLGQDSTWSVNSTAAPLVTVVQKTSGHTTH